MTGKPTEQLKKGTRHSAGALEMGISVVIGLAIGSWMDEWLDTTPWWTIFWIACGTFAGMRSLYRLTKRIEAEAQEEENAEGSSGFADSSGSAEAVGTEPGDDDRAK